MTVSAARVAPRARTVVTTLVVAALASAVAAGLLGLVALALGASPDFPPVQPYIAMPFAAAGTLAAIGGWVLVVRLVSRSSAALRVIVPVALVLSWIPDAVLLATGFVPGGSPLAVVALMLMHAAAAASGVLAGRRIAPAQ